MKIKYLFPLFIAIAALLTSCDDEDQVTLLKEIRVSSSSVAIPMQGGKATITVTAQDTWTAEKVITKTDSIKWLEISSVKGDAGETELTFSATSAIDGRAAEVLLKCAGQTQRVNIIQGVAKISDATVAEVKGGPDGKTFRLKGVCTVIENTEYGNWRLTDVTGTILIYGTLDEKGGKKNFKSLGLEVGDEVIIEGPKSTYGDAAQLVDVTVIEINKSLVKVDSVENEVLPLEGGIFTAFLISKGEGVSVEIPEDAKSWLSISSIQQSGTDAVVKFLAAKNDGGDRGITIVFKTMKDGKEYSTQTALTQKGAIVDATVEEFLAAEVGDTQYRLKGVIKEIPLDKNTGKYNKYGNLYLEDFSGRAYVYGIQDFEKKGLKEGDIITIVGKRAAYKETPQVAGAVLEEVVSVSPAAIAEVLTKPDSKEDYFLVTGEVTLIENPVYGNLYLKEGDSEIYLYGCYPGYGATGDARKGLLEKKDIKVGDKLTVIATKGTHNGKVQLANGVYFSHESAK